LGRIATVSQIDFAQAVVSQMYRKFLQLLLETRVK
jgi:hypothetical protein